MRFAILAAAVVLSGCASMTQLSERPAEHSFVSAKTADELEQCLATNLSGYAAPATTRGPGRRTMVFGTSSAVIFMATIVEGEPNHVEMRGQHRLQPKMIERASVCA